jgi:putative copper export protein
VVLLPRADPTELHRVLPRFSLVAILCVTTLAVTGVMHALAEADGLRHLVHGPYGLLLAGKLVMVGVMLVLGNEGRRYTATRLEALVVGDRSRLQVVCITIGAELVLGGVILALSAWLSLARV